MAAKRRRADSVRPRAASSASSGDTMLGVVAGVGLTYFVFTPHGFEHPLHWLVAGGGGLLGGVGVWMYQNRERLFVRPRWPWSGRRPTP